MSLDLGVLDTVISMVVVILLLSMVVQSLQTFLKKLFRFKSRQIARSLSKLFDMAAATNPMATATTQPFVHAATAANVLEHFRTLGRATLMGRHAVESISKEDLSKVVASIEGASIVPEALKPPIATFFGAVTDAQKGIAALAAVRLPDPAAAKLVELRTKIAPVAAHVGQLFEGGQLNANLLVRDVLSLGTLEHTAGVQAATELQALIEQAAAANPGDKTLQDAAVSAANVARALGDVQVRLAQLTARLRERVSALETWYDTVMLGFEERYARHMRTFAFVISVIVTVFLNADAFQVYKRLATDDVARARVMNESNLVQQRYLARLESARQAKNAALVQDLSAQLDAELDEVAQSYPALGLTPLDYRGISRWSIAGWLVMALLLSLGAPFWHDTLESLFGLKNLLRQKGNIQKVEQQSGAGLTRT